MNEALELCKLCDERTLGLILALLRRTQGSSAASVITNLQASSEAGSSLAQEYPRGVRSSRQRIAANGRRGPSNQAPLWAGRASCAFGINANPFENGRASDDFFTC